MAASVLDGEITFFSELKGDKITFVANKRQVVEVGSDPNSDIRIYGADERHMRFELDSAGKVRKFRDTHTTGILCSLSLNSL